MRKNLALLGFSLLSAVVAAELALRWLRPDLRPPKMPAETSWKTLIHRPSDVPGLAYELRPGSETTVWGVPVRVNRQGMRDDEPRPDAPGLTRIAVLGDSFTFGFGVPGEAAYPNVLERMLSRDAGSRFEVLNFGVTGYSTWDAALVLEHKALAWDPRLVVLGYVLNDPEIDPTQPLQETFAAAGAWRRSSLLRLIGRWRRARDLRRLGGGDYFRYLHALGERKWRDVVAAFERMGALAKERDLPLLLVIFPWPPDEGAWEPYPYLDIHRQVAAAARSAGFAVLDLYRPFSRHEPRELTLPSGDHHPNVLGHRVAAHAIYRWIVVDSEGAGVRSRIATGPDAPASPSSRR